MRDGHDAEAVLNKILGTPIEMIPFSVQQAGIAALLLPITKPFGLSFADRACLSLAMMQNVPALTADRVWAQIGLDVEINLIR